MAKAAVWIFVSGTSMIVTQVACSSSSGGGGGTVLCGIVSGEWSMSGDCPANPASCTVTQTECSATLNCDTGSATASVSGTKLSFTFQAAQCTGMVDNGTFSGTCSANGSTCSVGGTCTSGACMKIDGSAATNDGGGS